MMSRSETLTDKLIARAKNNYFVAWAIIIFTLLAASAALINQLTPLFRIGANQLKLQSFELAQAVAPNANDKMLCSESAKLFALPRLPYDDNAVPSQQGKSEPISFDLHFYFINHSDTDALIEEVSFDTMRTSLTASVEPDKPYGPVVSDYKYEFPLNSQSDKSHLVLKPPYKIGARKSGPFSLRVHTAPYEWDCMEIKPTFKTSQGTISAERFVVRLP